LLAFNALFFPHRGVAMRIRRRINTFLRPSLELLEQRIAPANATLLQAYGQLPISFEANVGQTAAQVQYLAHGSGYALFLTSTSAVLSLENGSTKAADPSTPPTAVIEGTPTPTNVTGLALTMNLLGANPNAAVVGLDKQLGISNYFIGNDPSQWHTGIANYSKVEYQNAYPGVNLIYYGNQQQLEYDFVVAPGSDPSSIRLGFQGADSVSLDAQGNLVLASASGNVVEHAPVVYQEVGGVRQAVAGQFVMRGNNEVGFQVGGYDANLPLTIDPVLSYSTYLGSISNLPGLGIPVDSSGNAYVTGDTVSFPTTAGAFQPNLSAPGYSDAFVAKLNATGTALIYSTYLGGNHSDYANGIAVDGSGNAYATGFTASTDFPTTSGAFQTTQNGAIGNAFVTKLNAIGTALIYSTYLGGNNSDYASSIAVDNSGSAYVTGFASSSNFPTTSGAFQTSHAADSGNRDAFVTKVNASGDALAYSSYLGGNNYDYGYGIAVDASGNAYVTGYSASTDFPTTSGSFHTSYGGEGDAFVTKVNAVGTALIFSTYLGGSNGDDTTGIALDNSGNAYVTGYTTSTNFATSGAFQTSITANADPHAFVTKLNATGTALIYRTYLEGTNNEDEAYGIAVDGSGNAYVTGGTTSTTFPTTSGAYQTSNSGGNYDAFVTKLNATGAALIYSTYLGGTIQDEAYGIALDYSDNAYIVGVTNSPNFPVTSGAYQTNFGSGSQDAFVCKLSFAPTVTVSSSSPTSTYGSAVSFSATVAANGGDPTPSGTIQFFIDGSITSFDTETLDDGSVTSAFISTLNAGSHTITVAYSGDSNYPAGTSSLPGGQTVNQAPLTITAGPSPFTSTASMATARVAQTATLLGNGKVLVTGGTDGDNTYFSSAELYDPASDTWSPAASMTTARASHTATLLENGDVLVAGGGNGNPLSSAGLYDPISNTWSSAGSMAAARYDQTATLLGDGKVLVTGGVGVGGVFLSSVELYDPTSNTWSSAASMSSARVGQTATLLENGQVLVTGGAGVDNVSLSSAELYDPASNTWSSASSMTTARGSQTATLLGNGHVLVAGGLSINGTVLSSAELYDPASNTWSSAGSMTSARVTQSATLLGNGKVLVAGGYDGYSTYYSSAELFDPTSNTWSSAGSMATGRFLPTATLLGDGEVLVVGGTESNNALSSAELYNPANDIKVYDGTTNSAATPTVVGLQGTDTVTGLSESYDNPNVGTGKTLSVNAGYTIDDGNGGNNYIVTTVNDTNGVITPASLTITAGPSPFATAASMATARDDQTATLLGNGMVLVAGGNNYVTNSSNAELYNPASNTWSSAGSMATARTGQTATLLGDGMVLVAGGSAGSGGLSSAELYDPAINTWSTAGSMATGRFGQTATLLGDGMVLVAGGSAGSGGLSSAELYDPASNTWSSAASMATARYLPTATLLGNGKVLVTGGTNSTSDNLSSAELYDPASNTWSSAGSMAVAGYGQTATLLENGMVLVAGGVNSTNGTLFRAELYDPATNTWSSAGSMATGRFAQGAILLGNGAVLVVGGATGVVDMPVTSLSSAELYHPTSNTWSSAGSMATARDTFAATLLANGTVLIAGGSNNNSVALSSAELYNPANDIKVYDGTTNSVATPTVVGLQGTDTVTGLSESYDTPNVGTGKTLTVNAGYTINDGNGGNNYIVTTVTDTNGVITPAPTTTSLADNGPNPSNWGDAVSFTATVSGGPAITGETVFIEDASNANAVVASPTLSGGTVTFTISNLTGGTHNLFAVYNGDDNNVGSNSSATPVTQVVTDLSAPVWLSDVVNGGSPQYVDQLGHSFSLAGQNSVVEQILVTFNEPVTLDPDAFSVVPFSISTDGNVHPGQVLVNSGPNPNQVAPLLNDPIEVGDGHQWIITFGNNAATTPNGSGFYVLKDGVYTLHIDHTKVSANSQNMAADNDTGFWALYGDTNYHHISGVDLNVGTGYVGDGYSDASVGSTDFVGFKSCYNADASNYYAPPNYNVEYDANLDGSDASSDFVQFKTNYNADWQF
jgi:Bacterial Ig-like domain (group 3)/Kelch motif/Beta-propeller repeat/YDG domain/Galactose oxidase, central domain